MKNEIADDEELIKTLAAIKREFFFRLKDETQPAQKEFSYIDLLNILDEVLSPITKAELAKYEHERSTSELGKNMLKEFEPHFVGWTSDDPEHQVKLDEFKNQIVSVFQKTQEGKK